jgi:hypothetical protein
MRPELKEVTMAEIDAVMNPQTPTGDEYSNCFLNSTADDGYCNSPSKRGSSEIIQPFQHKFEVMKLDEEDLLNHTENNDVRENHTIIEEDEREKT